MVEVETRNRTVVGLAQIPGMSMKAYGSKEEQHLFFPYSVGLLQAYAQEKLEDPDAFEFIPPIFRRRSVEEGVARLGGADIVGFSIYVWNARLSLKIAKQIKEEHPETIVVFGGPEVPDHAEEWLRKNPFVDLACHGEGEQIFMQILERMSTKDWSDVPSLSYIREGEFINNARGPRLADVSTAPSPYLSGTFDNILAEVPNGTWIPIWETNRGCPFQCTFCDWGSAIGGKVYKFEMDRLKEEIQWFAKHRVQFVYTADANFGMLKRDLELAQLLVESKKTTGYPFWVSLQSTKNATDRSYEVQSRLSNAGMIHRTGVTLSMQSLDPTVLKSIKRDNISIASFQDLQQRFNRDRIPTYTDMILGLPDETYSSFADGVSGLIAKSQHNRVQFYNCSLLPNAEMAAPEYRKKYGLKTQFVKMVEMHAPLERPGEVDEYLETCIATDSMPHEEWVRSKVFSWLTEFLHYDRVAQLPFVLMTRLYGINHRELMESFTEADLTDFPTLEGVLTLLRDGARRIQAGGTEFFPSEKWLGIYWTADEMALIHVVTNFNVETLYQEIERVLIGLLERKGIEHDKRLVAEAVRLNWRVLCMPFVFDDLDLELNYNLWEVFQGAVVGEEVPLVEGKHSYRIHRKAQVFYSMEHWAGLLSARMSDKASFIYEVTSSKEEAPQRALPVAGR